MSCIFEIANDALFCIFEFLLPCDFLSVSQTCHEMHKIAIHHPAVNKYWKHQCYLQWDQIQHECSESSSYSCKLTDKNSTFYALFQSILDFIMKTLLGTHRSSLQGLFDIPNDTCNTMFADNKKKQILIDILVKKVYNNTITINKIATHPPNTYLLNYIIEADNIDLFKIWLCNMRRLGNDHESIDHNDKNSKCFDINAKIKPPADTILVQVIYKNAIDIATFILGKNISTNNYNFANIDLSVYLQRSKDTLLTYCAYHRRSKVLSLLINHPSMTKKLINKIDSNYNDLTPFHCAVTRNYNNQLLAQDKDDHDDVLNIVTMLLNDKRTDINKCSFSGETPLMTAISTYPEIAIILIGNDKCDVNILTKSVTNPTALHTYAINAKNTDVYLKLGEKFLQRKDLNCNIVNKQGKTPLDIAKDRKLDVIIDILIKCSVESTCL